LTTKRVPFKTVVKELLWILKGQTDSKILAAQGCHIWDANGSREFLDRGGFKMRNVGDLGPVYGFQWRHWGADYPDTKGGVDQIAGLVNGIKRNPVGRRHIISAWNVADIPKMALPPCHMMAQFFVSGDELSCHLYQRSADLGLGVPFNIASYSILTHIIARLCGLKPGEFVHTMGDTHVYKNHIKQLTEMCRRPPRQFPTLKITGKLDTVADINTLTVADFRLIGYNPHPTIKMSMAL
jgi:thymidylate synthase